MIESLATSYGGAPAQPVQHDGDGTREVDAGAAQPRRASIPITELFGPPAKPDVLNGPDRKGGPGASDSEAGPPISGPDAPLGQLGGGQPLDGTTGSRMGSAFGTSFSDVRVHTDAAAGSLAQQQSAHAFTIGNHVAFAPGKFTPGTVEGDKLLGHELTHVQQQRGGAGAAVQNKREGGGDDAAEQDADRGAIAAVAHLHGGKAEKASASVTSGVQVQRSGDSHPMAQTTGYYSALTTFDGDRFDVSISSTAVAGNTLIGADIKYIGDDDGDGHEAAFILGTNIGQPLQVKVTTDQPDSWARLTIDPHGNGTIVGTVKHRTKLLDGWNPRSREHSFTFLERGSLTNESKTVIKSKAALPGTATAPASPGASDVNAFRIDVAALTTKRWLDEIVTDSKYRANATKPPWATLKARVDADAAKYSAPVDDAHAHDEALRLTRLGETITRIRPTLLALGAASKPEAYLPDIADEATALIANVRRLYEAGVQASWDGPGTAELDAADAAFNTVWYGISALYMKEGKGANAMILSAGAAAADVQQLRGGNRPQSIYPLLEADIGVPGSNAPGDGRAANIVALQRWETIRAGFLQGEAGTMNKVANLVQDVQVMAGLAALLSTIEIFHSFEAELSGIVATVVDRAPFTTNYAKVAAGYRVRFEAVAVGAERDLKAGKGLGDVGPSAVKAFQAICDDNFKHDCDDIRSRIKTVKTIEALGKVLAIIGVSALTGGAAGAAVGGLLEGAGAGAALVASGEFVAEVVTFTMASRAGNQAVFGGNQTSLGEDLITNAMMFGFLKAASAAYGQVFKAISDPRAHKTAHALGGAMTGMVGLQVFAEIHTKVKTGKMMDWDERMAGVFSNAVMLTCMSLGGSLVNGKGRELRNEMFAFAAKNVPGAMERLNAKVADLAAALAPFKGKAPVNDTHLMALLDKVETVWNEQVSVLAKVAESAPAERKAAAAKRFKEQVAEMGTEIAKVDLQLASAGIDLDLGANQGAHLFRLRSPGYVVFKAEGLDVLRDFYKENHGELAPEKEGLFRGKDGSGTTFYIAEDHADGFMDQPAAKPPTEVEARRNRATAGHATDQNLERSHQLRKLVSPQIHDGHVMHKFGRVIEGNGLAAAIDANTLPGAARGTAPPALTELPSTIGLGTGAETFAKLGDTPIGQSAPELSAGGGWAQGASPADMTSSHGGYTSAGSVASATALTQYRSGVPILDGAVLEVSIRRDATWKVPDAKVRIKAKLRDGSEVYLYADATDIATGLGPPNQLDPGKINADPHKEARYKSTLEGDQRLVYGDQVGVQKGGGGKRVLVSGGSATGAWNANIARKLGAAVDWIARETRPGTPLKADDSKHKYQEIQNRLNGHEIAPADADEQIKALHAFDAARLPRNVQDADAAFNDAGIERSVREIASMTPTEDIPGEAPGRVRVTFTAGEGATYDQVVVSHGTKLGATGGQPGALTLARGLTMQPVVVAGRVVALESTYPPGAIRVVGAAMWSRAWIDGRIIVDFDAVGIYEKALKEQALEAPRDSPGNMLIHNVGKQIPAANAELGGSLTSSTNANTHSTRVQ